MDLQKAIAALKQYFGYDAFRPMQAEVITALLEKRDAVVLMPTGGGKSVCYQIPALLLSGTCVVVSPLISLMKDQVEALKANGIKAEFLNSSQDPETQRKIEDRYLFGRLNLLYVSPEKLVSSSFLPYIQKVRPTLFAIDEAHCISAWGHDFRPEYTQLRFLKEQFPAVPIVALTATADKLTRKDIVQQLNLNNPEIFIASFDRPNLSLEVRPGQRRLQQILDFIRQRKDQPGIIYCLSRKNTETLAANLQQAGYRTAFYHAGMTAEDRSKVQEDFINDRIPIICATIAFGMGIDKSNVRWIIHYNLPKNIEGYYQEIGRAGRDGTAADTLLFYSFQDVMMLRDILMKNGSGNEDVQLAKLERMQQYAEALACRRRILLSYFGEELNADCGNCDICKNPPARFDGTIPAQKAFSAVYRLGESVGTRVLIDILRGAQRKELIEKGYHKIKTYGAGRDIASSDWLSFLTQMINLGYLEIAHDQGHTLHLTAAAHRVLFEGEKVELVQMNTFRERAEVEKSKVQVSAPRERVRDDLFEALRQTRLKLAQKNGVPPYIIFTDATLEEMAAAKPMALDELRRISGIGEKKLEQYGDIFLKEIQGFLARNSEQFTGSTYRLTYELFKQGHSIEKIAADRSLTPSTILSHLVQVYEKGEPVDIYRFISEYEINAVQKTLKLIEPPVRIRDVQYLLREEMEPHKIRFALTYLKREKGLSF
ncbi:MAG: DNA helicase RecQ [Lewinellaceae bacterium]|nr:DNA helicase RecQ [Lewinellaceae bacterium]